MQCHPKRSSNFFTDIILPRRPKNKSILRLPIKDIQPEERPEHIIHAKSFIGSRLNPNGKFKLLFENIITHPRRNNPFMMSHLHRKGILEDRARRRNSQELGKISKINELIFKSEISSLANKMHPGRQLPPQRNLNESRSSFVYLRRSFKVSEECKSSLLTLNHETRRKPQDHNYSISYSKMKSMPAKKLPVPIKKEFSLRVSQRPKLRQKRAERSHTKNEEIRGWEDNQERLQIVPSQIHLNTQY